MYICVHMLCVTVLMCAEDCIMVNNHYAILCTVGTCIILLVSLVGEPGKALYEVLVIQTFRPDRLTAMLAVFVSSIMGDSFLAQSDQELNLAHIVEHEVSAKTPVLLASVVGYDASSRIDDLTVQMNKQCTPVAMGQLLLTQESMPHGS